VRSKAVALAPSSHDQTWFHFLDHHHDWCLSRQLWWGHRIPAYQVHAPGHARHHAWIVARSLEEARAKAEALNDGSLDGRPSSQDASAAIPPTFELVQDQDVLDTWFSSALLPLSALVTTRIVK
jgi:valyl-tRNA synthetase